MSASGADSLHRLVMDLHKGLNRLAAANAEADVAGAHAYGLHASDRPAIEAFMRGLAATRGLKFDHPGLSTTATRSSPKLSIQNDIGETDAHVVVVTVQEDEVRLIYTDVHLPRAKFFTRQFKDFSVEWGGLDRKTAEGLGEDGVFYLVTGTFRFDHDKERDALLEQIGASLVFLIDWNKARKVLRAWVSKGDAIATLDWAARHRVGHRGFLEMGGNELVAAAVHHAAPTRIGFGERLDDALGRESALAFLKNVLRISTESLLGGGSVRLARDRIEAELVQRLQRIDAQLFAMLVRQAGLARDIAVDIARFLAAHRAGKAADGAALVGRARRIEEKADRLAIEARREIARLEADPALEQFVNAIEQGIDDLEQGAFICSLTPTRIVPELLKPLGDLCTAAIAAAEAAASGVVAAGQLFQKRRVDSDDALAAIGRLADAEHAADAAERTVTAVLLGGEHDLRTSLSLLELARAIERSTDRLAGLGHLLRHHVIAQLSAS